MQDMRLILLTGATGYVGGRLLSALEARGERVRCLARRPEVLRPRVAPTTEVVEGDIADAGAALEGVHTAFYLVHTMDAHGDWERRDREAAAAFGYQSLELIRA